MNDHFSQSIDPEFDRQLEQTASRLDIPPVILHRMLRNAWYSNRERFDDETLEILWETEKLGGYSIQQIGLIGCGIRKNIGVMSSLTCIQTVKKMILAGADFDRVMQWLILGIQA